MVGLLFWIARFIWRRIQTSVFHKSTFSGLGSSFFSFCSFWFKINSIKTLIACRFNVCSNYTDMNCEFNFLKTFFTSHGFPVSLVNSIKRSFNRIGLCPHHQIALLGRNFTYLCLILVISLKNFELNCLSCCQSTFHLLIFILSLLITIKSGPSSHTKTSFLSPCNPLWCIYLVAHTEKKNRSI